MLFNFTLTPLDLIQPWGEEGQQHLSWFGLTDGQYWIQVGEDTLFEYSHTVRELAGFPRFCDYQVVRLYEDIVEMTPYVLEAVPSTLIPFLTGDTGRAWDDRFAAWSEATDGKLNDDRCYEIVDAAVMWVGDRLLDSAYLSPSANIRMWSDQEAVTIEWDNSQKLVSGLPAWSASRGKFQLPKEVFIAEVRSFHDRLMAQMAARLDSVIAGALPSTVSIDLDGLKKEHLIRCRSIDMAFVGPFPATDWRKVHQSIAEIESMV